MGQKSVDDNIIHLGRGSDLSVLFSKASHLQKQPSNSERSNRFYTLIATTDDGTTFKHEHVIATVAGRKRNQFRKYGWKVDLYEEGTESTNFERTPNLVSGSLVMADPNVTKHYTKREREAIENLRKINLAPLNDKEVKKRGSTVTVPIRIYNNTTGRIIFSGSLEDAVEFLQAQIGKTLTQTNWTIYLPEKIYKAITR